MTAPRLWYDEPQDVSNKNDIINDHYISRKGRCRNDHAEAVRCLNNIGYDWGNNGLINAVTYKTEVRFINQYVKDNLDYSRTLPEPLAPAHSDKEHVKEVFDEITERVVNKAYNELYDDHKQDYYLQKKQEE